MKSAATSSTACPDTSENRERRKRLGQYFTGPKLAGLLARIAFAEKATTVIDPMAGNGDMLEAVARLAPAAELYGIELDIRLAESARQRLGGRAQIVTGTAFSWDSIASLSQLEFDLVITNPPYVRYQSLSANTEENLLDTEKVRSGLLGIVSQLPGLPEQERKIYASLARSYSGLSDLAVPSWFLCAMLVKRGGTLAMVAPESWLTRDYASCVHYLLLKLFRLRWVVENQARDWFDDAEVKTTLLVAQRAPQARELSTLAPGERCIHVVLESKARDNRSPVGGAFPNRSDPDSALRTLIVHAERGAPPPVDGLTIFRRDASARLEDLLASARDLPWLRALEPWVASRGPAQTRTAKIPQLLLDLLSIDEAARLRSLSDIGVNVGQGLRTGANVFFYCTLLQTGDEFSLVEPVKKLGGPVLVPNEALGYVLRKQAEAPEGFTVDLTRLRGRVLLLDAFSPPESTTPERGRRLMTDGLRDLVITAQTTNAGSARSPKPIPQLSAVRTNVIPPGAKNGWRARHWFMLPPLTRRHRPDMFVARVNYMHPKTMCNPGRRAVIDANFSTLWIEPTESGPKVMAILALMNSAWCVAAMELLGTVMGGGALKLEATHLRKLPVPHLSADEWRQLENLGELLASSQLADWVIDQVDSVIAHALSGPNASRLIAALHGITAQCLEARRRK